MQRKVASLPESIKELCLIRLGIQARTWRALPAVLRLGRGIDRAAREAIAGGAGLLHHEAFFFGPRHFGILQYWKTFADLEQWSHRPPHADWWREAVERSRTRKDVGLYHEVYLVPRANVESIYLDCDPVGMLAFGTVGEATGSMTTSRDRLGRRA